MFATIVSGQNDRQLALALEPVARQEPLKALAGVSGGGRFVGWRGRSGRRYVASRFAISDDATLGFAGSVLLAVGSDGRIVAALARDDNADDHAVTAWRAAMIAAGAIEIHLHLVAASDAERRTVVADLGPRAN